MRIMSIVAMLLAGSLSVSAESKKPSTGFKMPSKSFTINQLDQALEEARTEGKIMTFMVSDTETKSPTCTDASKKIIQKMKGDSVLIYLSDHKALPAAVLSLIEGKAVGGGIPYAIVTDAEMKTLMGIVTCEEINHNASRAFRELDKVVKENQKGSAGGPGPGNPQR